MIMIHTLNERVVPMTKKNSEKTIHIYQSILILLLISAMIVFKFVDFHLFENAKDATIVTNSILRFLGGVVFVIILIGFGSSWVFRCKNTAKSFLIIIPALIISINNFPIIALFDGKASLTEPVYRVYLFFIECLSIGFFEEIIFRGIILVVLIKKLAHLKNGVFLSIVFSSALFGLIHIFNIYSGAAIGDTVLQMWYSFLVGMMWAVMYLKTGNLWLTMLLHATFNFFGQVMFYLGNVEGRYDIYTIGTTMVLAVVVTLYSMKLFKQLPDKPIPNL